MSWANCPPGELCDEDERKDAAVLGGGGGGGGLLRMTMLSTEDSA